MRLADQILQAGGDAFVALGIKAIRAYGYDVKLWKITFGIHNAVAALKKRGKLAMRHVNPLFALLLALPLLGCGKPVPQDKATYVGEWQDKTMYLLITQDGSVKYKRLKSGATTSVEGPLKGFSGDDFEVGVGPMSTTFMVSKPPYQDGDKWKMIVDGVELTKSVE